MAESVSIVLNFLRQHNFGRAEEALLSELHARHAFTKPVHGQNKAEHISYTEGFPAHEDEHFHVEKSTFRDLLLKPESDVPERRGSIAMHAHTEWEFKSCSNDDCVLEFRKRDAQSRVSPLQAELYVSSNDTHLGHDGMGPMNGVHHKENDIDRMKGHEIKNRDFLREFDNGTHHKPFFSQKQHKDHGILYYRNESLHLQTCEKPHLRTNSPENALHTTWQPRRDDCFQQDLGASELKKCTVVHELREVSEKAASEVNANALHRNIQGFASSAYDAFAENSWLDHGVPDDDALKSSKFVQPSFLPFPSSDGFEQQEEKQVAHDCIDYLKALGLENQTYRTDSFKEMKLPWEVGLQNGFTEGEPLVNERQTPDFVIVPPAFSRSADGNFYFTKGSGDSSGFERILDGQDQVHPNAVFEPSFNIGAFLDIPVGQEIALPGDKHESGIGRLSASQNYMQDTPELLSGFATLGDEPTDPGMVYCKECWDSDMYEDDDDPGYDRQPVEDEDWFLAHEVLYPSDDDKTKLNNGKATEVILSHSIKGSEFVSEKEDASLLSRELLYDGGRGISQAKIGPDISSITNLFGQSSLNDALTLNQIGNMSYDGHLMDAEELRLMRVEPVWQAFGPQMGQQELQEEDSGREFGKSDVEYMKKPMRCINAADLRTYIDTDKAAEGNKWGREPLHDSRTQGYLAPELILSYDNQAMYSAELIDNGGGIPSNLESDLPSRDVQQHCLNYIKDGDESPCLDTFDVRDIKGYKPGPTGFSFSSQSRNCDLDAYNSRAGCPAWLKETVSPSQGGQAYGADVLRSDDKLSVWRQESHEPSPMSSPKSETCSNVALFPHPKVSNHFGVDNKPCATGDETALCTYDSAVNGLVVEDGEASAVQEDWQLMKAEEDEFEVFSLRIIHRKNRTGFEEEKHFQVVLNSVIAGRYLITEYLGSAAFSKAVQARDLQTGMDVCMKIIKNNKDFFDQSLDEIKLLKFINKNDPADKHHILRLYDYFYHREHLFIVCELLRANLYEFHKFNRESGGEAYFTMARLQSITRQCLEALEFLHYLGLIHCDLKPENILIKSYSRCEIKVIDLGSSCFQTDHLCSYVQSRSYRAPEVILGLPYDQKIDIWSLGCILAELCSGNVLFQNDSLATLLARVVGIIGPIMPDMILKGREAHKYFTKNWMLFDRNQETNKLEYLVPKRSSLRHRLPTGDQGFVDFVGYLLQVNPENRPRASEALKHPWLTYPYEPIC